jgi:hypothetical protein
MGMNSAAFTNFSRIASIAAAVFVPASALPWIAGVLGYGKAKASGASDEQAFMSAAGNAFSGWVGGQAGGIVKDIAGGGAFGEIAAAVASSGTTSATNQLINRGDINEKAVKQAMLVGGTRSGVNELTKHIPGFNDLPVAVQKAVKAAMTAELTGGSGTDAALNSAINSAVSAGLTTIRDEWKNANKPTKKEYQDKLTAEYLAREQELADQYSAMPRKWADWSLTAPAEEQQRAAWQAVDAARNYDRHWLNPNDPLVAAAMEADGVVARLRGELQAEEHRLQDAAWDLEAQNTREYIARRDAYMQELDNSVNWKTPTEEENIAADEAAYRDEVSTAEAGNGTGNEFDMSYPEEAPYTGDPYSEWATEAQDFDMLYPEESTWPPYTGDIGYNPRPEDSENYLTSGADIVADINAGFDTPADYTLTGPPDKAAINSAIAGINVGFTGTLGNTNQNNTGNNTFDFGGSGSAYDTNSFYDAKYWDQNYGHNYADDATTNNAGTTVNGGTQMGYFDGDDSGWGDADWGEFDSDQEWWDDYNYWDEGNAPSITDLTISEEDPTQSDILADQYRGFNQDEILEHLAGSDVSVTDAEQIYGNLNDDPSAIYDFQAQHPGSFQGDGDAAFVSPLPSGQQPAQGSQASTSPISVNLGGIGGGSGGSSSRPVSSPATPPTPPRPTTPVAPGGLALTPSTTLGGIGGGGGGVSPTPQVPTGLASIGAGAAAPSAPWKPTNQNAMLAAQYSGFNQNDVLQHLAGAGVSQSTAEDVLGAMGTGYDPLAVGDYIKNNAGAFSGSGDASYLAAQGGMSTVYDKLKNALGLGPGGANSGNAAQGNLLNNLFGYLSAKDANKKWQNTQTDPYRDYRTSEELPLMRQASGAIRGEGADPGLLNLYKQSFTDPVGAYKRPEMQALNNQFMNQIQRRDAAAGRNSQYGARAVEAQNQYLTSALPSYRKDLTSGLDTLYKAARPQANDPNANQALAKAQIGADVGAGTAGFGLSKDLLGLFL